jgi:hypothetical protein
MALAGPGSAQAHDRHPDRVVGPQRGGPSMAGEGTTGEATDNATDEEAATADCVCH